MANASATPAPSGWESGVGGPRRRRSGALRVVRGARGVRAFFFAVGMVVPPGLAGSGRACA